MDLRQMVATQIQSRGVRNPRVLDALRAIDRRHFVPDLPAEEAYADHPLQIGHNQTISQPYIVALMTELLDPQPDERVLEIGTGCGYQTAVLAELAFRVYTIEIIGPLSERAQRTLEAMRYENIEYRIGDGWNGWPEHAPFNAILAAASPERVPQPLLEQLAMGGRLVMPIGPPYHQRLQVYTRTVQGLERKDSIAVTFVPMTGRAQQDPTDEA